MKKYLIIAPCNNDICLKHWLNDEKNANFDLVLIYYGDNKDEYTKLLTYTPNVIKMKGFKYPNYYKLFKSKQDLLKYKYFWFPDDDIKLSTHDINTMFDIASKHQLYLSQPSVSRDNNNSDHEVCNNQNTYFRYTNFVEVMSPLFSLDGLNICLDTFNESISGWGLDEAWAKILSSLKHKMAVIDSIKVEHVRKIGSGSLYTKLQEMGISHIQEMNNLREKYGYDMNKETLTEVYKIDLTKRTYHHIYNKLTNMYNIHSDGAIIVGENFNDGKNDSNDLRKALEDFYRRYNQQCLIKNNNFYITINKKYEKLALIYTANNRFNYGDLMYQIILDKILKDKNIDIIPISINSTKMVECGVNDSQSINDIKNNYEKYKNKSVFVGGGDVLPLTYDELYSHLNTDVELSSIKNNVKFETPFVIDDDDIINNFNIFYQSFGGSSLNDNNITETIKYNITNSDYFYCRDKYTSKQIGDILYKPDLVSIVSSYFDKRNLLKYNNLNVQDYIVFQTNIYAYRNVSKLDIIDELKKLQFTLNLPIILLPIGNCNGHHDYDALKDIHQYKEIDTILINSTDVYEVLSILANSKMFIGTSLHGCITSMAYNIPFVPLNKQIKKIRDYMDTWSSISNYRNISDLDNFYNNAIENYTIPLNNIEAQNIKMKDEMYSYIEFIQSFL